MASKSNLKHHGFRSHIALSDDQITLLTEECSSEDLPGDLPDVADFIGLKNALMLAAHLGCGPVYLRKWSEDQDQWSTEISRMVDVIGHANTATIVRLFDGDWINIPKCDSLFRRKRNEFIDQEKETKTITELAREYNLSKRHIKRIIQQANNSAKKVKTKGVI